MATERILVADDDPSLLSMVSWLLREHGYEVQTADRGNVVLEALEGPPPDLVLLDIMMPYVSGFDVLQEIRTFPHRESTPVIMLTAKGQPTDRTRALELGATDFLTKPFSPNKLLGRIDELFAG